MESIILLVFCCSSPCLEAMRASKLLRMVLMWDLTESRRLQMRLKSVKISFKTCFWMSSNRSTKEGFFVLSMKNFFLEYRDCTVSAFSWKNCAKSTAFKLKLALHQRYERRGVAVLRAHWHFQSHIVRFHALKIIVQRQNFDLGSLVFDFSKELQHNLFLLVKNGFQHWHESQVERKRQLNRLRNMMQGYTAKSTWSAAQPPNAFERLQFTLMIALVRLDR